MARRGTLCSLGIELNDVAGDRFDDAGLRAQPYMAAFWRLLLFGEHDNRFRLDAGGDARHCGLGGIAGFGCAVRLATARHVALGGYGHLTSQSTAIITRPPEISSKTSRTDPVRDISKL